MMSAHAWKKVNNLQGAGLAAYLKLLISFVLTLFVVGAPLFIAGCGDDSIAPEDDLQIVSFISSPSGEMDENSTAIVEAMVKDLSHQDGRSNSGLSVTFAATPPSLGYFTPATDTTDANGMVSSVFTATSSGNVILTASAGGDLKTLAITINDIAASSGRISLEVTPILMLANGIDSADILITALDGQGNSVTDGTVIYLTAGERFLDRDGDGYWSENIDSLIFDANANNRWDPIGIIPSSVTTTNGNATATYKSGYQATTVYIRATLIDDFGTDYVEVTAKLNPNTSVASITLTHYGEDLRVRGVGGIEFSIVTATAYDEFGNSVPEGIPISFTIASGPNGGENIQNEGYGPVEVFTNSLGEADVTVYSGTVSGTIKLRATSGNVLSAVTHLVINAGPPAHITVGVQSCNVRAFDKINVGNRVIAIVNDMWGNPVPDSTGVWFSTNSGMVEAYGLTGVGLPKGETEVNWSSGEPRNGGDARIYACTDGGHYGELCDTVGFISSGPLAYVNITEYPSTLVADGESKGRVLVELYDLNYQFMVVGTAIDFETDFGTISGGGSEDGCYYSLYKTDYYSEVLKKDYSPVSPDDGIGAYATVVVQGGGMGGPTNFFITQFLTGETYYKNSSIEIETEIEPSMTVPFTVVIKDRPGNPLGGHSLTISPSIGTVSGSDFVTNQYGEVGSFYTAPLSVGTCIITVTDNDPRGQVSIAKKIKIKYED